MTDDAKDVLRGGYALLGAARDLVADHRRALAEVHGRSRRCGRRRRGSSSGRSRWRG